MRRLQGQHGFRGVRKAELRRFRFLGVRRVLTRIAAQDGVLAARGQHVEFVREAAADGAAVGFDRPELDAEPAENPLVRLEHLPVLAVGVRIVDMKRVAVLHDELAAAHEAEAGTNLVTELRLNLKQVQRQLLVARDDLADDVGRPLQRRPDEVGVLSPERRSSFP